jgi:hypothetical protein
MPTTGIPDVGILTKGLAKRKATDGAAGICKIKFQAGTLQKNNSRNFFR